MISASLSPTFVFCIPRHAIDSKAMHYFGCHYINKSVSKFADSRDPKIFTCSFCSKTHRVASRGVPILRKSEIDLFSWRKTEIYVILTDFGHKNSDGNGNIISCLENGNCQYNSHRHSKS